MATVASSSSHPCEAPPAFRRLPLIISESLRSPLSSDGSSPQGIVSILLSTTDLGKLDLSKLQLFSVDGLAVEAMASSEVVSAQTEVKPSPDDDFSFHTPSVFSSVAALPSGATAFPVLKSKGVVEAEKACAEHRLLKLGAVSPSLRARKKAVSMDEMTLNDNLSNFDTGSSGNAAEQMNGGVGMARSRVRARRHLPELELAALPAPGLEQRAETLRKKHLERVLSRTLSEIRSEEATIDLRASSTKFVLQVMPWELTSSATPVTTPAGIPFIWEDVPGRPKPGALPSACPSLPLPPRLVLASSSSSSSGVAAARNLACPSPNSSEFVLAHLDGMQSSPAKSKPSHGRTHRKNMHSWHVFQNLLSGGYQRCPSHAVDVSLEAHTPAHELNIPAITGSEASGDGVSSGSTSVHSNSASSDLSLSTVTASEDRLSYRESGLGTCYELPPTYAAPIVPLTPPHRDTGPLKDGCGKWRLSDFARLFHREKHQWSKASKTGFCFSLSNKRGKVSTENNSYLLVDDASGRQMRKRFAYGMHTDELSAMAASETAKEGASAQMPPIAASLYQSPKQSEPRMQISSGRMKVFLKLRRRGSRVIVASSKAVKRALFLGRASHSKLVDRIQSPYHTLHR